LGQKRLFSLFFTVMSWGVGYLESKKSGASCGQAEVSLRAKSAFVQGLARRRGYGQAKPHCERKLRGFTFAARATLYFAVLLQRRRKFPLSVRDFSFFLQLYINESVKFVTISTDFYFF